MTDTSTKAMQGRFQDSSVPDQEDFEVLIDYVDSARKAAGQSTAAKPSTGALGLIGNTLSIVAATNGGLSTQSGALHIVQGAGFEKNSTSLKILEGVGIQATTDLHLRLAPAPGGLDDSGGPLTIKHGDGLREMPYDKLDTLELLAGPGLSDDGGPLSVQLVPNASGLALGTAGIAVALRTDGWLTFDQKSGFLKVDFQAILAKVL